MTGARRGPVGAATRGLLDHLASTNRAAAATSPLHDDQASIERGCSLTPDPSEPDRERG